MNFLLKQFELTYLPKCQAQRVLWFIGIFLFNIAFAKTPKVPNARKDNEPKLVDWAYSPIHLMELSKLELEVYSNLNIEDNVISEEFIYPEIHWWISEFKEQFPKKPLDLESIDALEISEIVCSHPFLTLRMIKRFSRINRDLEKFDVTVDATTIAFIGQIEKFQTEFILPNQTDVGNIIKSILELQFMYDLNTDELYRGKFGDVDTKVGLTLLEAYELGQFAYEARLFPEALHWMETVYSEILQSSANSVPSVSKDAAFGLILDITREHDALLDEITDSTNFQHDSGHYHRFTNKINSKNRLVTLKEYDVWDFKRSKNLDSFPAYSLLCAGKDYRPEIDRSKLYCWLERESNLAWLLSPLKIEVHSWDPYIVQIYNVVGDAVIQGLNESLLSNMERGSIAQYEEADSVSGLVNVSMLRTCSSAVISENDQRKRTVVQGLDKKIEKITGLIVSNIQDPYFHASEQFKVTSYAFGGQFYPHMDAFAGSGPDDTDVYGDRLATFMIYLNNVHRGGNTVFPLLGIHVLPEKGSALFWFDLMKNGSPDTRTLHAGCPVMFGQKWIASKWIRYNANFQTRKCATNEFE